MNTTLRPDLRRPGAAARRGFGIMAVVLAMSACGGGADSGSQMVTVALPPLPTLKQDVDFGGPVLDRRAQNNFRAMPGDTWIYDVDIDGRRVPEGATRTVAAAADAPGSVDVTEWFAGQRFVARQRRTSAGIESPLPLVDAMPATARDLVGLGTRYPESLPPSADGTRSVVRQGDWGEDLTGDGVNESFRYDLTQGPVRSDPVKLAWGTVSQLLQVRTRVTLAVHPSTSDFLPLSVWMTEDTWWVPNVGLVKREVRLQVGDEQPRTETWTLARARLDGRRVLDPEPDGSLVKVPLRHRAVVFDTRRNRYLASVPGDVPIHGNRIAIIDAATGALSWSPTSVGSEPDALAIDSDGDTLYVGLRGSGELLGLHLPTWSETLRLRFPADTFNRPTRPVRIAASPGEPGVLVVMAGAIDDGFTFPGLHLVRSGAIAPRSVVMATGSATWAIDASGRFVHGWTSGSPTGTLSRIDLRSDGLVVDDNVPVNASGPGMAATARGLLIGTGLHRVPDLQELGRLTIEGGSFCTPAWADRIACPAYQADIGIRLIELDTLAELGSPAFNRGPLSGGVVTLTPGPRGQLAIGVRMGSSDALATGLWLFGSEELTR